MNNLVQSILLSVLRKRKPVLDFDIDLFIKETTFDISTLAEHRDFFNEIGLNKLAILDYSEIRNRLENNLPIDAFSYLVTKKFKNYAKDISIDLPVLVSDEEDGCFTYKIPLDSSTCVVVSTSFFSRLSRLVVHTSAKANSIFLINNQEPAWLNLGEMIRDLNMVVNKHIKKIAEKNKVLISFRNSSDIMGSTPFYYNSIFISSFEQFVILHENAHIVFERNNTKDFSESEADTYAAEQIYKNLFEIEKFAQMSYINYIEKEDILNRLFGPLIYLCAYILFEKIYNRNYASIIKRFNAYIEYATKYVFYSDHPQELEWAFRTINTLLNFIEISKFSKKEDGIIPKNRFDIFYQKQEIENARQEYGDPESGKLSVIGSGKYYYRIICLKRNRLGLPKAIMVQTNDSNITSDFNRTKADSKLDSATGAPKAPLVVSPLKSDTDAFVRKTAGSQMAYKKFDGAIFGNAILARDARKYLLGK